MLQLRALVDVAGHGQRLDAKCACFFRGLLDLFARGLSTEEAILFVIDGAKALRSAITDIFGQLALIQRCQVHKERNILDHLPDTLKLGTRRALRDAYSCPDAALAERQLERLASSLERDHPGAAASVREGLPDTLTLHRLAINGALYRSLRSTNPIENLNGAIAQFAHNVRRWRNGAMIVRWVATAIREAEKQFRRLKGYKEMPRLIAALDAHAESLRLDTKQKVA
jgi:transposase-like protein